MADEFWVIKESSSLQQSGSSSSTSPEVVGVTKDPVWAGNDRGTRAAAFNAAVLKLNGGVRQAS